MQLSEFLVKEPSLQVSPHSFYREKYSNSRTLHLSVKVPGKISPTPGSPLGGPYGERCPFPEASFTFLWASPINKLS
jgi:hypothetical protein